jgi:hypothetical protein
MQRIPNHVEGRADPKPRTEVEHAAYVSKRAIGLQRMRAWAAGRTTRPQRTEGTE